MKKPAFSWFFRLGRSYIFASLSRLESKTQSDIGLELVHPVGIKANDALLPVIWDITNTGGIVVDNRA